MMYFNSEFKNPQIFYDDMYGGYYAADMFMCPYNVSYLFAAYPECHNGYMTNSVYVDPNVPDSEYHECHPYWINDGM